MTSPLVPLLGSNFRTWLSAKGFWLVLASALLPLILTGAWVATHRADVTASGLEFPESVREGDSVTFRAHITNTGPVALGTFNATLAVGTVSGGSLFPLGSETVTIDAMEPGASREITLEWTAQSGTLFAVAFADQDDVVAEVDEFDNQDAKPLAVAYAMPPATDAPAAPPAAAGDANATETADLAVASLARPELRPGQPASLEAVVTNRGDAAANATVVVRVGRGFAGTLFSPTETRTPVTLEHGASQTVTLTWTAEEGAWWHEAWIEPGAGVRDAAPADNHKVEGFTADPFIPADIQRPEIEEKLTIKQFYLNVLSLLYLRLLLPLIALFYAAGVIADERERGALPYMLTRPLPRWLIPITKFVASFAVGAIAALVSLLLTYALLFRATPGGGDLGYLMTPVLASLLTLFVYGALFTLIGVWAKRPYLVGLAWILGWENAAALFVPWVRNLTLTTHIGNALAGWSLGEGLQWVPQGEDAMRAFLLLLAVGAGLLVASSAMMKRREFEV